MTVAELRKLLEGLPDEAVMALEANEYLIEISVVNMKTGRLVRAGYTDDIEESDETLVIVS